MRGSFQMIFFLSRIPLLSQCQCSPRFPPNRAKVEEFWTNVTYSLEEILDPHMSAALFANETLYSMLNPRERNSSGLATRLSFFTTNTGSGRQA